LKYIKTEIDSEWIVSEFTRKYEATERCGK